MAESGGHVALAAKALGSAAPNYGLFFLKPN